MAKKKSPITTELNYLPQLPSDRSTPIGCIGSGFIMADCHLVSYRDNGFNPVAIASRKEANAGKVAERHNIARVYKDYKELLADKEVQVIDVAVPPDVQLQVVKDAVKEKSHIRGMLLQKPLAMNYKQAARIVKLCKDAGITLVVNENMRYDQSVRAMKDVLDRGYIGEPVLATIDMRAIPHWMPWQERLGWLTLRIMSIHHLDSFRFWFGDPQRVYCSTRKDPRTKFKHSDGICAYILEYKSGLRAMSLDDVWAGPAREGAAADIGIHYRIEGTQGMARGTIGWPSYPERTPSTLEFTTTAEEKWHQPTWDKVWFPDAFAGPMAELLCSLETGEKPSLNGKDNLKTMALVDACYKSAREHRAVTLKEVMKK